MTVLQTRECSTLVRSIARTQREIDSFDDEFAERAAMRTSRHAATMPPVGTLDQWFASYGRPKEHPPSRLTTFQANTKVYGATNHHRAFKTQATTMKKGRY